MQRRMRVRVLVCGNLFVCGPHGFAHRPELDSRRAWAAAVVRLRAAETWARAERFSQAAAPERLVSVDM